MFRVTTLSFIILSLFTFTATAQQIVTDRPDQTESSLVVPKGAFQIESGVQANYDDNFDLNKATFLLPTNLLRIGLHHAFELRVVSQLERISNPSINADFSGISDLQIGTKIQLLRAEERNIEMAILSHLVLPTGSQGFRGDGIGTINKLAISHTLHDRLGVGYNLGYNYLQEGNGDLTYSVALGYSLNEEIGVYIEPFGELSNLQTHQMFADGGATYLLKENVQFDFSFGTGITRRSNYIAFGCSWLLL